MNSEIEQSLAGLVTDSDASIKQSISIGNLLVVRVDTDNTIKYGDDSLDRNVYAFDQAGERIWQIQAAPINQSPKPYMNLSIKNNSLVAENWVGISVLVDLENGSVVPYDVGQRPW